jgi:hypothetical protein
LEPFEIRWQNFRSFKDTGWVRFRPLSVILGSNASGKTSLLAPLLLLKQTLESSDRRLALRTRGDLFDAGSFTDAVFDRVSGEGITFGLRFNRVSKGPAKGKPVRAHPAAQVQLSFLVPEAATSPVLQSFEATDSIGRRMLTRVRQKTGNYSVSDLGLGQIDPRIKSAIRNDQPVRFLFSAEPILKTIFGSHERSNAAREEGAPDIGIREVKIPREAALYLAIITRVATHFEQLLRPLSFIGPLREHPRRVYELLGEKPRQVGTRGEFAPEILNREKGSELIKNVNRWVETFGFGFSLECERCGEDAFSIVVNRGSGKPSLNVADTGFGLSQVLPLIVQGYYGSDRGVIIAEQPEIHLNPRLQTLLADLFVDVSSSVRGVIVETHSEHLLLRLRRLVAEKKLRNDQVSLLYVEQDGGVSRVREIQIEENGHIKDEDWPKDFFADSLRESLGLAMAQSRGEQHAE